MRSLLDRTWLSPFVVSSFIVLSISGILMMADVKSRALTGLHEVIGVLFVLAGALHLLRNWSAFLSCFRNKRCTITIFAVLLLSSLIFLGDTFSGDHGSSETSGGKGHSRADHR